MCIEYWSHRLYHSQQFYAYGCYDQIEVVQLDFGILLIDSDVVLLLEQVPTRDGKYPQIVHNEND